MAANFCSNCGKGVTQEDKFCPECGNSLVLETLASEIPSDLDIGQPQVQYVQQVRPDRKDPDIAALTSLIIVGVGHFYVGKWWRGLGFMAAAIIFYWATIWMFGLGVIAIWILAPIDAYDQAKKHNLKYGYSEEATGEATGGAWGHLIDHAGIFGGIFFMIGLLGLFVVLAQGAFIWIFIPIIFIVLGIGSLYLNLTKFRYGT